MKCEICGKSEDVKIVKVAGSRDGEKVAVCKKCRDAGKSAPKPSKGW